MLDLPTHADSSGALSVIDGLLPFPMKRVSWIHGADGTLRGGHYHRQTRQALTALPSRVTVHRDDDLHIEDIFLQSPDRCLLVEPEGWRTMELGSGPLFLVIASHSYDKNEYIDEPCER